MQQKEILLAWTAFLALLFWANADLSRVLQGTAELEDWLIATRRELHQYPELMFEVRAEQLVFCGRNQGGLMLPCPFAMSPCRNTTRVQPFGAY